jgi:2-phospho-L-lactate transferase/gluconeogenesis factor (CofD/UPF0052 family)
VRIVIFTGGTGSIALQRGLYRALNANFDGVDTKIIVNAYDNGLSTGAVRRVMDGRILGPSDVRKNQATRLELESPFSPWLDFLNCRFTVAASEARAFCMAKVAELVNNLDLPGLQVDCRKMLSSAVAEYFEAPLAAELHCDDFSLANVVYAGLARANGNSLRAAAGIMARALCIPDNVLLNDDHSLFLGAVTHSGKRITDEGEIVRWDNAADPFVDVFFTDVEGNFRNPELCLEARRAIMEADLIILSSGTQWSSLIPTYASSGFAATINGCDARILMVMNRTPDRDSPSQSASDIINILVPRYFETGRLHVIADANGHPSMHSLDDEALARVAAFTRANLSTADDPANRHNPGRLAAIIGKVFFEEYLDSNLFLFDYDDTLVGRQNEYPRSSRYNTSGVSRLNRLTDVGICTGNTIASVALADEPVCAGEALEPKRRSLIVFADGGINKYAYDIHGAGEKEANNPALIQCIWPDALLPTAGPHSVDNIINNLLGAGIPACKIHNRGNAVIAIRPVDHGSRQTLMGVVQRILGGSSLEVRERGTTTIEICRPELSKAWALMHLRASSPVSPRITYVGDECESGNDRDIEQLASKETGVNCLRVDSPAKTAFFISTLITYLTENAVH